MECWAWQSLHAGLLEGEKIAVVMLQIVNIFNYAPSCLPRNLGQFYSKNRTVPFSTSPFLLISAYRATMMANSTQCLHGGSHGVTIENRIYLFDNLC